MKSHASIPRLAGVIAIVFVVNATHAESLRDWECQNMKDDYQRLKKELLVDPYQECMSRPENQRPGRAMVCSAEASGARLRQTTKRKQFEELDARIRQQCFNNS